MQLKMSKPFDDGFVKQLLLQEDEFVSKIFSETPLPMYKLVSDNQNKIVTHNEVNAPRDNILLNSTIEKKRAETFEELHAKLEGLKNSKRLGYKEKQLKRNLKSKIKKISKRKERSMQKNLVKTEGNAADLPKIKKEDIEVPKIPRPKPVFNSEGKMVFSKFDFSEIGTKKKPPKKDPKRMLLEIKQRKEKLREMEESGEREKAQEFKEKNAWKSVLAKAGGDKVKDDPDLLKRTLKRKEQQKKKSAKKWETRLGNVQKGILERQKKRQDNIMAKKKEKKLTKLKRAAKKGRVIPGF
ncbi:Surfeit locus protein 6 like protein [Habropoda laboriosa]|uniref:Surfeit locus protein 6 like protein n=1 Tax=Habropoda laboriosa TaxID=597456 RepID=A0A0L7R5G2_9HYME|nr:PREDICTED: surfeit locus protein 6 homolog [Habropoda laboriosa]KOC65996.1 Surfeit locus protein 6 like protein [Habropoda laboriosa]